MSGSQKFIARNRAPRVQIEYDVELYGAEKKVQLPFVMGVLSDLSGKSEQPPVADRKFLEIDVDSFDERMKSMAPRAAFTVPNTLTGEGNMAVDLTFESMDDFSPAAIASKVPALAPLLEARRRLDNLMAYMDGKSGAEALVENLLAEPELLKALGGGETDAHDMDAALRSLKARMPEPEPEDTSVDRTLSDLAARAPQDLAHGPSVDDVLGTIDAPQDAPQEDGIDDVLDRISRTPDAADTADVDAREAAFEALRNADLPTEEEDTSDAVLEGLSKSAPEEPEDRDDAADVLAGIERKPESEERDETSDVLAAVERREDISGEDKSADVLAGIQRRQDETENNTSDDVLAGIERTEETVQDDRASDVLAGLERRELTEERDRTDDVLSSIDRTEKPTEDDKAADVLAGIERRQDDKEDDHSADVLAGIERADDLEETDDSLDILAGVERAEDKELEDPTAKILASLEPAVEDSADGSEVDNILSGLDTVDEHASATDDSSAVLGGLRDGAAAEVQGDRTTDDIREGTDAPEKTEEGAETADEVLASLEPGQGYNSPASEAAEDVASSDTSIAPSDGGGDATGEASQLDDLLADTHAESGTSSAAASLAEAHASEDLDTLLSELDAEEGDSPEADTVEADDLDALLEGPATDDADRKNDDGSAELNFSEEEDTDDLDALLADLGGDDTSGNHEDEENGADKDLDALLSDMGSDDENDIGTSEAEVEAEVDADESPEDEASSATDDFGDLLADTNSPASVAATGGSDDELDALLADLGTDDESNGAAQPADPLTSDPEAESTAIEDSGTDDELDALLADLEATDVGARQEEDLDSLLGVSEEEDAPGNEAKDGDLDDLLADMGAAEVGEAADANDDLDALLADLTGDGAEGEAGDSGDDLDDLLADMGATELGEETAEAPTTEVKEEVSAVPAQSPYGTISAPQPERDSMNRRKFRMAIFGDFTGRSSRGLMETGDALAARRPILLDVDTVEDVIEGFATTLTLPIGRDGAGIEVKLGELDDLHPDELYEKVEIFEAISGLRQQLSVGSMAGRATEQLKGWAEEFGTPVKLPKRSAGTSVPPDLKLSDFQALIGDTRGTLTQATPADDLIARIVGPHVVKGPDAGAAEMLEAVDAALSAAMRLVLHHPDFQAVEGQWRSLDLLARRIETDSDLEIVLYDVSAEEMAADLSAQEDLGKSGLYRLLTDVMDPEDGDGGFSALFGFYTFEETPPHAELLARIGLVAAHVDAPFFAAITPTYLETPKQERHKLVAEAWDKLRALPQAAYLGLASPRFMLRQPYGAKSDPCYEFEFEEFTPREGLRGLLWANPVVLVAILLAATHKKDGRAMELGSLMSLGDIPFTYVTDRYGDQVALPCTERNLTSDAAQATLVRGYMPVLSIKGRNEIRLGSFRSLAGDEIAGPWSDTAPARAAPPDATLEMDVQAGGAAGAAVADEDPLADLDSLLDTGDDTATGTSEDGLDLLDSGDDDDGQSLDDLLASFADDDDAAGDDDDMDPELAALLEGL